MRSISAQGNLAAVRGAQQTVMAGRPQGEALGSVSFGGLRGGTWTISPNPGVAIDADGTLRATDVFLVEGATYDATVSFAYSSGGLSLNLSQTIRLNAVNPQLTIDNTDETSDADVAQVLGAVEAFAEASALTNTTSSQIADNDTRLTALEN